ncbi:sensor histidine kinase [Sphingomonas sp. CCH9-E2]|uniref:sensor histidine kinase n=2 Tax=unclassified Sphingomonas TaxID=196159 RepID=UPI0008368724|nr:HAMP domain-containing sensor histidine kinase [Sphingomonas sp. CCH9-E2]
MRYDDTLETVLAGDVSTSFGKASAWRQLVDLIGRRRIAADARAFNLLRRIRDDVPIGVRAASARALEQGNPPAPLVALCALDHISVAAPLLRTARMTSGEWVELLPRLSAAARSVLRTRRDLPPGIERALETFGSVDFVVTGAVAEAEADAVAPSEPVEAAAVDDAPVTAGAEVLLPVAPEPLSEVEAPFADVIDAAELVAESSAEPVAAAGAAPADAIDAVTAEIAEGVPAEPAEAVDEAQPVAVETPITPIGASEPVLTDAPPEPEPVAVKDEPVADALPTSVEEAVPDAAAITAAGSVLDAVARVESRVRMRLRPVLEPVEPPQAAEVPANTLPFVSVGAAALSIPAVARALEGEGLSAPIPEPIAEPAIEPTQSGTDAEPSVALPLAAESGDGHGSDMDDVFILGNAQDDATGSDALVDEPAGPFEIAEVVARIDAFYTLQQERAAHAPQPVRVDGFRFETDEQGVIRWVEGVSRAPLIGLSLELNASGDASRADGVAAGALRQRAVFSDARLMVVGESDAAGEWRISGAPAFDRATGRFSGYRGTARRPRREESAAPSIPPPSSPAADSLRQLMHELRTPTNAIAGFAEMIEREMLGDAPPVYRERAGTIRMHARALLAAIDDLDIAARIEASALTLGSSEVTLRPLLSRIADDLAALAELRGAWIALPIDDPVVRGDARAIERMLSRLLATLLSAARDGERVGIAVEEVGALVAITFDRPEALAAYEGDALFNLDDEDEDAALLGTGFALRLVRNIARELGGGLKVTDAAITLELPAMVTKSLEQAR